METMILSARIASEECFSDLSVADRSMFCDELMLRCAAIYGSNPPASMGLSQIVSLEMDTLICTAYPHLGREEITLAIRINSTPSVRYPPGVDLEPIRFFGEFVNVSFISKVIQNYVSIRNLIDRKIQNHIDGY